MLDRAWDLFVNTLTRLFLPLVYSYFALSSSLFLNMSDSQSTGLAKVADVLFVPSHYLFAGQQAHQAENGLWEWSPRFQYKDSFWPKTVASAIALPPSLILGSLAKWVSFLSPTASQRYASMKEAWISTQATPHLDLYRTIGLGDPTTPFKSEGLARRPGAENHMSSGKECLKEIGDLLNQAGIPWWIDCGTCLGTYRYGGIIPWDEDIDIAILSVDSENVRRALNALDGAKYAVQDWSGRGLPHTLFKVFVKETQAMIDVYHFDVDLEAKELKFILSLEDSLFFPEWWKVRERRFKEPVPFATVFPLRKTTFDGVEVFIPQNPKKYLQRYYGENLAPAKIYDPEKDEYVKDLSHEYWQRSYVH